MWTIASYIKKIFNINFNSSHDVAYIITHCTALNSSLHFRYQIRPRYIRDTSDFNIKMRLLGEVIEFPIYISPTGGISLLHWEGDIATARGQ